MIALIVVGLLAAAAEKPSVVSVHAVSVEGRAALEVVTSGAPARVGLDRTPSEAVLTLDARLPRDLGTVAPVAPLQAVMVQKTEAGVAVRVRVDASVPHEVRRQGTLLTVLFGGAGTAAAAAAAPAAVAAAAGSDVQELYRGLLPGGTTDAATAPANADALDPSMTASEADGLQVGLLTLRPSVSTVFVDAEGSLLGISAPLGDRYFDIRPQMQAEMPVGTGRLRGDYEARIHRGSQFPLVENGTTHLANANLELPLGSAVTTRASGHYAKGVLETTEVDPGREYFFDLGPYERYDVGGGLRIETGSRLDLDLSASHYSVDVADQAGFFDHQGWSGGAGLGFELGPRLRGMVGYLYEEIPTAEDRPEALMHAHSGAFSLQGEILPLVTGQVSVGYRDQRNPLAGEGGTRYTGLSAGVRLVKEFTPSTTLQISGSRTTPPSAFESNGYFVASSIMGELNFGLPLSFVGLVGGGYHDNKYRVASEEIGAPRHDTITSWNAGIGRNVSEWAFLRVDYRYELRQSNLDQFDTDGWAFMAQVGLRMYRQRARP